MNPLKRMSSSLLLAIHIKSKQYCYFVKYTSVLYRHSPEMIRKLERAGLGYYVQSVNTKQKLGIV